MKRILTLLLSGAICLGSTNVIPSVVYAADAAMTESYDTVQLPEAAAQHKPNSLSTVYVSSHGKPDASGADVQNPINDFAQACSLVKMYGSIVVVDEITVENVKFPAKQMTLQGGQAERARITFEGETNFNWMYVRDLEVAFHGPVFLNGQRVEMKNTAILGYPDIYAGAKDRNTPDGDNGSLMLENNEILPCQINNIIFGGFGDYTVESGSVELRNASVSGIIDGSGVRERSYLTLAGQSKVSQLRHLSKLILLDNTRAYLQAQVQDVRELYGDQSTIVLQGELPLEIDYLFGDICVEFDAVPSGTLLVDGKNFVGDFFISDELTRQGYRINKVRSGTGMKISLLNPLGGNMDTNFAPTIKHQKDIVVWEGTAPDLHKDVSAWDFEDGDLTDQIVFPSEDLSKLPIGVHKIVYQVKDSHGNVTSSTQTVHVITNARPVFQGLAPLELRVKDIAAFDPKQGITVKDDKDANLDFEVEGTITVPKPDTEETFVLTYRTRDTDGHVTTAERSIHVTNYVPKIEGMTPVQLYKGDAFDFLEAVAANDVEDGKITDITVENLPDRNQPGTYEVVYTVTDSDGNTAKAVRHVTIKNWVDWEEIVPAKPAEPKPTEPKPVEPVKNPFADVFVSDYYYKPVLWAVENGITAGVSPTRFAPMQPCTRGQIVTFLWSAADKPKPKSTSNPFVDVKPDDYYYEAVLWAVENGITAGVSSTRFAPEQPCTRAQAVTFLWSVAKKPHASVDSVFSDVTKTDYYYDAVLWAVENGITAGVGGGRFAPMQTCTRGQIVTFLYQAYN